MNAPVLVHVDIEDQPLLAGRLWIRTRGGRTSASFEYDAAWLKDPRRFSLEPALELGPGPFQTANDQPLFGAIGDSAPDRWGRLLMRRAERRRATAARQTPRSLQEVDFLLGVSDLGRQGALRLSQSEGGPFLATQSAAQIPPLVRLAELLAAANHVLEESESESDLRLLLAPGSSVGGARPKALVTDDDGALSIAKFPDPRDDVDVVRWECVALQLAARAGISAAECRLVPLAKSRVLLIRRFDRAGPGRIPYLSAMTMLGAVDNETRSYLEIVDAISRHGAAPEADRQELWKRIVFSILISNVDDHLRNHGFLYTGTGGWRLSPAFDLNPVPVDVRPRVLTTMITEDDGTASLDLAYEVAPQFGIGPAQSKEIVSDVARATATWREVAATAGLRKRDLDRMATAFVHEDFRVARGG